MRLPLRLLAAVVCLAVFILGSCHQLTNPADPNSPAYGGVPITKEPLDPDKSTFMPPLPEIVQWRAYAEHLPGQWIWQEITADGSFVESRAMIDPARFLIGVVFEGRVDQETLRNSLALIGTNNQGHQLNPPLFDTKKLDQYEGEIGEFIFFHKYPDDADENGSRFRIRLINPDGSIASERAFAWLRGDVDGSGRVQTAGGLDDDERLNGEDGTIPDPARPYSVRSDINLNGIVEGSGGPDWIDVDNRVGNSVDIVEVPQL